MAITKNEADFSLGHFIGIVRKDAGLTQAELASKITLSPATVSRIEAGESSINDAEREAILEAIGTPAAADLREYIRQGWVLERPPFDHPDRKSLWEANAAIKRLRDLREDPTINSVFIRQIDLYEKELFRYADFLYGREHQLAFIGSVGVGKTTAICRLTGLTVPGEVKLDRQSVLTASGGRTTVCEVHISRGPQFGIRIVPRTDESIRRDVEEYAEYLVNVIRVDAPLKPEPGDGETAGTSTELERAIRNMADLPRGERDEGGKKVKYDRAKELALQHPKASDLAVQILTRMDLFSRTKRDAWYPEGTQKSPQKWLQEIYSDVNNGKHPEFTLPQKIEVVVPDPVIGSEQFPLRVVDTKGIDSEIVARQDLECHFDDRKTVVVLCSSFNNAPEVPLENLLLRAREAGVRDFEPKTVILVLPRSDEAAAVMKDDGQPVESDEEGYDRKREQVEMQLRQRGIGDVSILFFNARESGEPEPIRQQLIATLKRFRRMYCDRIAKLSEEVDWLIKNRENEEIRSVFQDVGRHLTTWIGKNRVMDVEETPVEKPLVAAIDGTRHAGTIRASVRRSGEWQDLDYYHHLAVGARRLAVKQIGAKIGKFADIVKNLMDGDEYAPAQEFLERVIDSLAAAAETAYRTAQVGGREAFESELRKDFAFWKQCDGEWGKGKGYKARILEKTEEQFQSSYRDAHELVKKLITDEWAKIVTLLEGMLREESGQTEPAAIGR